MFVQCYQCLFFSPILQKSKKWSGSVLHMKGPEIWSRFSLIFIIMHHTINSLQSYASIWHCRPESIFGHIKASSHYLMQIAIQGFPMRHIQHVPLSNLAQPITYNECIMESLVLIEVPHTSNILLSAAAIWYDALTSYNMQTHDSMSGNKTCCSLLSNL